MGEELERLIRERHQAGDIAGALTAALEGYGREVMGFLVVRTGNEADAGDVFSLLAEDMWKGLAGFTWRSSFRTWMYVLARNAAYRYGKSNKAAGVPLSRISEVAQRVRTETLQYLRTEAKDQLDELRQSLSPEDQLIVVLRTKRGLSWDEVAAVLMGHEDVDGPEVKRAAARYRQRFKTLKERLRDQAQLAGLVSRSS